MRIGVVLPLVRPLEYQRTLARDWQAVASPGTEIVVEALSEGPDHVVSAAQVAAVTPFVVAQIRGFEGRVDAVIVSCFCDPGVTEARAVSRMPVIGAGEATLLIASQTVARFAISTPVVQADMAEMIKGKTFGAEVTSVREVPPEVYAQVRERPAVVGDRIVRDMQDAVDNEGAELICLGCCGFPKFKQQVQEATGLPTVDPRSASIAVAEFLVRATAFSSTLALSEV